ncbi:MAG: S8 family serine peptidase [Candidatus Sericytochromatia bacterium]
MRKIIFALSFSTLFSCSLPTLNTSNNINSEQLNNFIIRFKDNININQINNLNTNIGIKAEKISNTLNMFEIKATNQAFQNIKIKYEKSGLINYIEGDSKLALFPYQIIKDDKTFSSKSISSVRPNDTFYGLQWNAASIDADKVWSLTTGSKDITVAVIDSGVDPDHPDLVNNLLPMIDILNESGEKDIYTSGFNDVDYTGKDGNGHGTHVTGILGASINNAKGIAGIAGNVKILPIKVANYEGNTSASIITKAILKAIDKGVRVINLSIGAPKSEGTQALKDAVQLAINKNIVFVSAIGNESARSAGIITPVTVPAAYQGVISVAATTKYNKVANYSNGGAEVEIAAPGGGVLSTEGDKIYSTWPTYKTYEGFRVGITGPYATLYGTSMACPHVSAVAALILSREPNLTAQQVRIRLLSSTIDIDVKGFDEASGFGEVNALKAIILNTHDRK